METFPLLFRLGWRFGWVSMHKTNKTQENNNGKVEKQ
jgi:hypothetical protein